MTPRSFLIAASIGIILLNILTVRFRRRHTQTLEKLLRTRAAEKGGEMSLEEISDWLGIHLYDARILTRKFISSGKMEVREDSEGKKYVFKL